MAHAKLACKTLCVFMFVFACFYLRSSSLTKVPLPVLVLDHSSNLCRREYDTCVSMVLFFFNWLGAKFSVFHLKRLLFQWKTKFTQFYSRYTIFCLTLLFMVGPLCFAAPDDIEELHFKRNQRKLWISRGYITFEWVLKII